MVTGATAYISKRRTMIRYEVCFVQASPTESIANWHGSCQRLGHRTLLTSMIHAKYPRINIVFIPD